VIRDSDGTKLSDEITRAGYRIYSTICIIREHNAFAEAHPDAQQQSFLFSKPLVAVGETLEIRPLEGYFAEQFELNDSPEAMEYWQVWDRTSNRLLGADEWEYSGGAVKINHCEPFHRYSVSFLAWRVWEEINMYNHTTNHWTSEHLRQLDPRHPLAWEYLKQWLKDWCEANPQTDVVRLTSLFYNFVWIFGDDMRFRSRFVDWASYDFTVSPAALKAFEEEYGYALTAEDFINKGLLQATHRPPTRAKKDYMDFIQRFVAEKAKALVDIIHAYGKQAYVFYDDSWVGMEPCGKYFPSIGFDGLIKCVFSGFECRLCALAKVETHELRFHPYLFPVGLGGLPTFSEGGEPEKDALSYWLHVRRALARQTVQRIGLGGYLHLTIGQDKFNDAIAVMARDFRRIKALHEGGAPATLPIRVAVMHYWGSLRSWTLSGHFHETDQNVLIHINEALSGLPVDVRFISFEDVKRGALNDVDVLINAGREGDAWSGGSVWRDSALVSEVTRFVYEGGSLIGVGEPSAAEGSDTLLALSHLFGVDLDKGQYACHASWTYETQKAPFLLAEDAIGKTKGIRVTSAGTQVFLDKDDTPVLTLNRFGSGQAVYMGGFTYSPKAARMLLELLKYLCGTDGNSAGAADDPMVECAWFEKARTLLVMNNAQTQESTRVSCPVGYKDLTLEPFETRFVEM
jgi:beta-D-galactosyl-(1->4)-L-rhamnose phosphorylase